MNALNSKKTLVVGSSGTVGRTLVELLKNQGVGVRETTSRTSNASGEQRVYLDLASGAGLADAFHGVEQAFLLSPPGYADQHRLLSPLIQQASRSGLTKVVLMTAMGANADDSIPFRRAELELEQSGLTYNIIRPNWFMQNFNTFWSESIRSDGAILLPAGEAKVSFVDTRDVARVAARLLSSDEHDNQAFDLTGPTAISHQDVADVIARRLNKPVFYKNIDPQQLKSSLLAAGLAETYVDFMIGIFGYLREGYNERTTDAVFKITGAQSTDFADYAKDHEGSWR